MNRSFIFTGSALLLLIALVNIAPLHAQNDGLVPVVIDCDAPNTCTAIAIEGDPIEHACLELNGTAFSDPCAIRGQFDASLWSDTAGTVWLAYTRVTLMFPDNTPQPDEFAPIYDIHLARSDDSGATWQYVNTAVEGLLYDHPTNGPGVIAHEVSDLAQNPDGTWSLVWLHYTRPYMVEAYNDVIVARKDAARPEALANAETQFHVSGWGANPLFPVDFRPAQPPDFQNCLVMTEPSIFTADGRSYFVVECISVDLSDPTFPRVFEEGTIELFEWIDGDYEHIGTLLDYSDARALTDSNGTMLSLEQPDVALSRSGEWLLLVTPNDLEQDPRYQGCRVLTIDDLSSASIQRNDDGTPAVRAVITAASQHLGAGQCTYHAASETGVIIGVGIEGVNELRLNLFATGFHP